MKTISRWIAIALILAGLASCGLPGAAVRSTGRMVDTASDYVGKAAGY